MTEQDTNTGSNSAEATVPVLSKQEEDAKRLKATHLQMLSDFVDFLPNYLGQDAAKTNLRLSKDGLFIKEDFLRKIFLAFQDFYKVRTSSNTSITIWKCKRKIFGEESLFQVYLIEGKICNVGYIIPFDAYSKRKTGIPYIDSKTMSAADFMHSRDPLLEGFSDARLSIQSGNSDIRVELSGEVFKINPLKIKEFHQLAKSSPLLIRRFKKIREAQRYALVAIVKMIKQARKLSAKKATLVPVGTEIYSTEAFRLWYDWMFVVDRSQNVQKIVELRGKNKHLFIRSQLDSLAERNAGKGKDYRVYRNPGKDIAEVKVGNSVYKVGSRCLENLESFFPFYISHYRPENLKYSLADFFDFFVSEFKKAYIVSPREVSWLLKGGKIKAFEYRFNKKWLFLVNNKRVVFAMIQAPGSYKEETPVEIKNLQK